MISASFVVAIGPSVYSFSFFFLFESECVEEGDEVDLCRQTTDRQQTTATATSPKGKGNRGGLKVSGCLSIYPSSSLFFFSGTLRYNGKKEQRKREEVEIKAELIE